jgi:hypothetical protein
MRISTTAVQMDDDSECKIRPLRNELINEHYRLIGEILSICEAGSLIVGVPWLPPSSATQELAEKFESPLADFVKLSLVTVNTNTLELYCDDLESCVSSSATADSLFIRSLPMLERHSFCVLFSVFAGCLSYWSSVSFGLGFATSLLISLSVATAFFAVLVTFCSESHRLYSFHCLLEHELMRRKGLDQPNSRPLGILPVETKPVSKC